MDTCIDSSMRDIPRAISYVRQRLCQRSKRRPWTTAFRIVVSHAMKRLRSSLTLLPITIEVIKVSICRNLEKLEVLFPQISLNAFGETSEGKTSSKPYCDMMKESTLTSVRPYSEVLSAEVLKCKRHGAPRI